MLTRFAHIWLREMSSPETEQVRLARHTAGGVSTLIMFLLLSYADQIRNWLLAFLINKLCFLHS